jgi:NAD+ diphosphatase
MQSLPKETRMTTSKSTVQKWFIFQNDSLIIMHHSNNHLPDADESLPFKQTLIRKHFLGHFNKSDVYCAEIPPDLTLDAIYNLIPLRKALDHLGDEWYAIATKAFGVINWDRNHHFCGRCGQLTAHSASTFERTCAHCKLHFYPRISPSIIVLIHHNDQILMARSHHFHPGVYGLIAGFVESGESVEDAVHRETYEETRIRIKNLRYFGSQPWPFPDSLMVGFFAEYDSGDLIIDPVEIEDAGWYRYDQLPGRPSTSISIASKMLDHFIRSKQVA